MSCRIHWVETPQRSANSVTVITLSMSIPAIIAVGKAAVKIISGFPRFSPCVAASRWYNQVMASNDTRTRKGETMDDQTGPATTKREPVVPLAVRRLEELAKESDDLVERLQSAFSGVLFAAPNSEDVVDHSVFTCSDLGTTLMRLADKIGDSFTAINGIIDSADI